MTVCLGYLVSTLGDGAAVVRARQRLSSAGNKMLPLENYRVRCMSMGFLMQVCHEKAPALDCSSG